MKTRNISLPLVILVILIMGCSAHAQQLAHYQLLAYLEKMPAAPVFPDSGTLASAQPTSFEDNSDLNAIEKKLQNLGKELTSDDLERGATETTSRTPPTTQSLPPSMKPTLDALETDLKDLQAIRLEYAANFRRLEDTYNQRIDKVEQAARSLQMEHPCKDDVNCKLLHMRLRNSGFVNASREKILNEEYLLSVYLSHVKPAFQRIDNLLHDANYGDRASTPEARSLFWGAQQNELTLLNDIIERIKLERIEISNCARLAQQGYRRK